MRAAHDLFGRGRDRVLHRPFELIDAGRLGLDQRERVHQRGHDRLPRDREVLDRALRLCAPLGIGGHAHLAHRVVLDAIAGLGHEILLAARYFLAMPEFAYQELLPIGADDTAYQLLTADHVSTFAAGGRTLRPGRARSAHAADEPGDVRHRPPAAARSPRAAAARSSTTPRRRPTIASSRSSS